MSEEPARQRRMENAKERKCPRDWSPVQELVSIGQQRCPSGIALGLDSARPSLCPFISTPIVEVSEIRICGIRRRKFDVRSDEYLCVRDWEHRDMGHEMSVSQNSGQTSHIGMLWISDELGRGPDTLAVENGRNLCTLWVNEYAQGDGRDSEKRHPEAGLV